MFLGKLRETEMKKSLRAIQYRNLKEAREVLSTIAAENILEDPFDDRGQEPQGLLSIIVQGWVPDETFYQLFHTGKGVTVEVEKISYSGFGPPAYEEHYMGFIGSEIAYVLSGCRLPIEIENCSYGARDIHHLEALILDHNHPLSKDHLATKLDLAETWDFEDLFYLIAEGQVTGNKIDQLIHLAIQ